MISAGDPITSAASCKEWLSDNIEWLRAAAKDGMTGTTSTPVHPQDEVVRMMSEGERCRVDGNCPSVNQSFKSMDAFFRQKVPLTMEDREGLEIIDNALSSDETKKAQGDQQDNTSLADSVAGLFKSAASYIFE